MSDAGDTQNIDNRVFGDRFQIERKLARGGMSDVFLARDTLLDRPVALKVLFPELSVDLSFVERFRREAQNAAKLSHPNIVSVYDWGEEDSTYYIVMEYVDGTSLSAMLHEKRLLPAEEAAEIGEGVAAALSFAHRNGVVHRDVKPGNVLIDSRGSVKVADFGIARVRSTQENLTQTGSVMGTATYFSPEQAQGLDVDERSDVYSLGVVLYEMVTGAPPFHGDNPVTIAYKHVRENPAPLNTFEPRIANDYQAIVAQAMTKSPVNRYQSAEALRLDLSRFRNGQSVSATSVLAGPSAANVPPATSIYAATTVNRRQSPSVPKDEKSLLVPVLVLVSLLALVGIGGVLLFGGAFQSNSKQVVVPDVIGKTLDDASSTLAREGLAFSVSKEPSDKPENTVISQDPGPGTTISSSRRVALIVSNGQAAVNVPDLNNKPIEEATRTLTGLGFKVATTDQSSDTFEKGRVISQSPTAGTSAKQGDTVRLVVSTGPETVAVPDVTGFTLATASQQLSNAGLRTSAPAGANSSAIVQSTDPPAGAQVTKGSTVAITIQVPTTTTSSSTTTSTSAPATTTTAP